MSQVIEEQKDTVYDYILTEEAGFEMPIDMDGWSWNMKRHIRLVEIYKNSQVESGKKEGTVDEKPVKNIVLPILNLRYRAEDIDVKDILLYVDDSDQYHLSFLVKKYHDDVFVLENDLDTFFDEIKESKIDYGAGLAKDIGQAKPDVVPLRTIAFADQTNLLNAPICVKHNLTPDELLNMVKSGWGDERNGATADIDTVLDAAEQSKKSNANIEVGTPGYYIPVYELHGVLPSRYLDIEGDRFTRQMQIIVYVEDAENKDKKKGITLFAKKESKSPFKAAFGDKIQGRALPRGGLEEILEPQVWTNYSMIRMKEMLDAVCKIVLKTDDPTLVAKHPSGLKRLDNMEIIELQEGRDLNVVDNQPRNFNLFDNFAAEWEVHARSLGAAQEGISGDQPPAGTPFKLQELIAAEAHSLHDYRRGQYAKWIEEVYRDWIIPYISRKIAEGKKFLTELSSDEMEFVADKIAENKANKIMVEAVLNGEIPPVKEVLKETLKEDFRKGGNDRFINILRNEIKNAPLKVKVNVANKQKDIALMTDKLVNIFRFVFSTYDPNSGQFGVFQNKGMVKLFNQIIESSGFNPVDFQFQTLPPAPSQPTKPNTEPLKELAKPKESPIPQQA